MMLIPYRSVLDLAYDLEHRDGRHADPPRGRGLLRSAPRRALALLRSVACWSPRTATKSRVLG
jgi:hypothetical protein